VQVLLDTAPGYEDWKNTSSYPRISLRWGSRHKWIVVCSGPGVPRLFPTFDLVVAPLAKGHKVLLPIPPAVLEGYDVVSLTCRTQANETPWVALEGMSGIALGFFIEVELRSQ